MPFTINRKFLLSLFLISHTLGKFQSQVDNTLALSLGFPLKYSPGEPFDKHPTNSDQIIDGDGDDDSEAGHQPSSDPLIDNTESPTFADGSVECAKPAQSPSKLRRSRLNKGQKSFCPWQEFRGSTSPTSPDSKQDASPPTGADEIWPKLDKETGILRLLFQLERAPGTYGESDFTVCEGTAGRTIPVCFPFRLNYPLVIRSPANLVEPCRFCKRFLPPLQSRFNQYLSILTSRTFIWIRLLTDLGSSSPCAGLKTDVCIETYEELWCCVAAKKRTAALLDISPSSFEVSKS